MDISLNCSICGSGEALILLHGNGEDHSYFAAQTEFFSRMRTVYAVDTRGHGMSQRGSAPFTISQFADDLNDFMDEHGIESAELLGFSDGGNIALMFALRYPHRVKKLILNGANLDPRGVKPSVQIPIVIGYLLSRLGKERSKAHTEMLALMTEQPHIAPQELAAVSCPTLVIAGTHDMIKTSHTRLIADSIKDSKLVFIKGGHFIAAKSPDEFNKAVADFLRTPVSR